MLSTVWNIKVDRNTAFERTWTQKKSELDSWCFEPSQSQRITSGLKTNFSLCPSYLLNKLQNVPHKIFTQLFKNTSNKQFPSTLYILYNTPISRKKSKILSGITLRKSEYRDLSSKYFLLISNKSAHSIKISLTVITAPHTTQTGASSLLKIKECVK